MTSTTTIAAHTAGHSFADAICKNIGWLSDAARRGDQAYVDQHLDTLWAFNERLNGRSGLSARPASEARTNG